MAEQLISGTLYGNSIGRRVHVVSEDAAQAICGFIKEIEHFDTDHGRTVRIQVDVLGARVDVEIGADTTVTLLELRESIPVVRPLFAEASS